MPLSARTDFAIKADIDHETPLNVKFDKLVGSETVQKDVRNALDSAVRELGKATDQDPDKIGQGVQVMKIRVEIDIDGGHCHGSVDVGF